MGRVIGDLDRGQDISQSDSERLRAVISPKDGQLMISDIQSRGPSTPRARYPGSAFGFGERLSDLR